MAGAPAIRSASTWTSGPSTSTPRRPSIVLRWRCRAQTGLGVVGTLGDGDGPTLILNGHVDVVPIGDARAVDGRPVGRDASATAACSAAAPAT